MPDDTSPQSQNAIEQAKDAQEKILAELDAEVKKANPEKTPDPWTALQDLEKEANEAYIAGDLSRMKEIDNEAIPLYDQEVANIEKSLKLIQENLEEKEDSYTAGEDDVTEGQVAEVKKSVGQWEEYQKQFVHDGHDLLEGLKRNIDELTIRHEQKKAAPTSAEGVPTDLQERVRAFKDDLARIERDFDEYVASFSPRP